jgi:sorting nexin-8
MPRKDSLDFPEADPWGSPALHKNHNHQASSPKVNGASRDIINAPVRTTSGFTTRIRGESGSNGTSQPPVDSQPNPPGEVWGSYDANPSAPFSNPSPGNGGDGFDPSRGGERPTSDVPSRSFGNRATATGVEENIVITLLPEKEGMFMFQHHNYQVGSARRGSKVVRRYSDFVWLLDCLQKRYPFRQLPLLPPKRVGGKQTCFFIHRIPDFLIWV